MTETTTIDSDDIDRVVQNLMAEHEAVTANAVLTTFCGEPAIAVLLDGDAPTAIAFLVDADGEPVTDQGRADDRVQAALAQVWS